jgi:RNA polymerase sigma-70 factor (ECF subfamily)
LNSAAHSLIHGRPSPLQTARKPAGEPGAQVAGRREDVPNWNVSPKPALRRSAGRDESPGDAGETAGAPPPFEDLFRTHAPYVGGLVLKLTGRPAYVDDIVQDVFIRAHRSLGRLRDPRAVRPWLRRIAVRSARRWLRKRWVLRWFRESDVAAHPDLVDANASPEQRAQIAQVYRMLERMPEIDRVVWVLRLVEGDTLEEIAAALGCSVSTVQRRLRVASAAMESLR